MPHALVGIGTGGEFHDLVEPTFLRSSRGITTFGRDSAFTLASWALPGARDFADPAPVRFSASIISAEGAARRPRL